MDSFVETPDGAGTIISVNTLRQKVRVRLDNEPDTLRTYQNDEIRVIRSGKGKRPEGYVEPPKEELEHLRKTSETPEDRLHREQMALVAALDSFLEENVEEQEKPSAAPRSRSRRGSGRPAGGKNLLPAEEQQPDQKKEGGSSRHRQRGHRGGGKHAQQAEGKPAQQSQPAKAEQEKKSSGRRWHYHRGRRKSGGGKQPGARED